MLYMKHITLPALIFSVASTTAPSRTHAGVDPPCTVSFDISSFDGSTNVLSAGDASITGGVLRVTPALQGQTGAAWYGDKVDVAPGFDTSFTFRISNGTADGFAFVIQDESNAARGGGGSAIGYGPGFDSQSNFLPGITRSVAIEFDTFGCCGEYDAPHVSVQTNGTGQNDAGDTFSLTAVAVPPIDDGQPHIARVVYSPGNLRVLLDGVEYINYFLDFQDISGDSILDAGGCAWLGFTGGTGAATADQDILNWTLGPSCARQFELTDFGSNPLSVAGSALVDANNRLVLTPAQSGQAGAAWYASKAHLANGFDTTFSFEITGAGDGFAFVIQDESDLALGGGGSGLGYGDNGAPGITRSVAIEFDIFSFGPPDEFTAPHVSLQTNGINENSAMDDASLSQALLPAITNNGPHTVRIHYATGAQPQFRVWLDDVEYLTVNLDLQGVFGWNILDPGGCAWIGFTAGTGGAVAQHEIIDWSFSAFTCPEPPCTREVLVWRSLRLDSSFANPGIDLDADATGDGLAGPTVESRAGGIRELQIEFDRPVTPVDLFGGVTVIGQTTLNGSPQTPVQYFHSSAGHGGPFISLYFDPGQLPDNACYTITLGPNFIEEPTIGDTEVKLRSLYGDTTGDGIVTLSDAILTRHKALAGASAADAPRFDLDLSGGTINSADVLAAKGRVAFPAHRTLCP